MNFESRLINSPAQLLLEAQIGEALMEDWLHENCPGYCKMEYDYYDRSLELYLDETQDDQIIDDEVIIKVINNWGFKLIFVNYTNKKEQHIYNIGLKSTIKEVTHSRWNKEMAAEYK